MVTTSRADEIVAIAAGMLEREGIDRFVMRRIADRAGMKLGNLQYYFPTRDDLLEAVVRAEFRNDLAAIDDVSDDGPDRRLARIVRTLGARWSLRNGSVYLPIAVLALHNDRLRRTLSEIYATFSEMMCDAVMAVDPAAAPATAHRRAFMITSLLDGASLQPGRNDPAIRDAVVHELERLALAIATGA